MSLKNSQKQKSKICSQHFLSTVKTHILKQTPAKSVKNWRRCYIFSIFTPPLIFGPPVQKILDIQNLKIKNKIPHIDAPYATNRSKIGWKFVEILRYRLSQDFTKTTAAEAKWLLEVHLRSHLTRRVVGTSFQAVILPHISRNTGTISLKHISKWSPL